MPWGGHNDAQAMVRVPHKNGAQEMNSVQCWVTKSTLRPPMSRAVALLYLSNCLVVVVVNVLEKASCGLAPAVLCLTCHLATKSHCISGVAAGV